MVLHDAGKAKGVVVHHRAYPRHHDPGGEERFDPVLQGVGVAELVEAHHSCTGNA